MKVTVNNSTSTFCIHPLGHRGEMAMNQNPSWNHRAQRNIHSYPPGAPHMIPPQRSPDPRMLNTGGAQSQDPSTDPPRYSLLHSNNLGPGRMPTTQNQYHDPSAAAGPSTAGPSWHGNAQRRTYLPPYSETGQPSLPGEGSASQFPQSPTNISRNSGSTQQRWGSQEYDRVDSVFNDYHNPDH